MLAGREDRMTTLSERQWNATRMLLCDGDRSGVQHAAPMPQIRAEGVSSSDIRCEECGSPMMIVDVLTIDRNPNLLSLVLDPGPPLYTTAKLNALALISAVNGPERIGGPG